MSFNFNKKLQLPEGWTIQNKSCYVPNRFELGQIESCYRDSGIYYIRVNGKTYYIRAHSHETAENQRQFQNQFPSFPYYKDEYLTELTNSRISKLEESVAAMVSHLETILVMLGERAADAHPLQLTGN